RRRGIVQKHVSVDHHLLPRGGHAVLNRAVVSVHLYGAAESQAVGACCGDRDSKAGGRTVELQRRADRIGRAGNPAAGDRAISGGDLEVQYSTAAVAVSDVNGLWIGGISEIEIANGHRNRQSDVDAAARSRLHKSA